MPLAGPLSLCVREFFLIFLFLSENSDTGTVSRKEGLAGYILGDFRSGIWEGREHSFMAFCSLHTLPGAFVYISTWITWTGEILPLFYRQVETLSLRGWVGWPELHGKFISQQWPTLPVPGLNYNLECCGVLIDVLSHTFAESISSHF